MRTSAEDELENTRGERFMKRAIWIVIMLVLLLGAKPAKAADNRFIVRTTGGLPLIQGVCALLGCNVVYGLDGSLNQLFLVTAPSSIDPNALLAILQSQLGVVAVELDRLVGLGAGLAEASAPPAGLWNSSPVNYYGATVWAGYVNQPAAGIVRVSDTQKAFNVAGAGIVADIDTGVDPNHPALRNVLLPGYDFTRNQPGGSEMRDVPAFAYSGQGQPAQVNQSTAAVLDQSTAAVLDTNVQYAAFGHGTMVVGIIHLVAPHALIMPLKAFHSDGTGYVSDILRAIYYAVQNKAKVINMSFDFTTYSKELARSMNYANRAGVICVASAGNDGKDELVYPAGLTNLVMGIASTSDADSRSSFSNYGQDIVWVAAPGEAIITTYPFSTYAAGSGTSFSAPLVSGGAALLLSVQMNCNQYQASQAIAHAKLLSPDLGHGRLDLYQAVSAWRKAVGLQ
jgi:hypothetical protein